MSRAQPGGAAAGGGGAARLAVPKGALLVRDLQHLHAPGAQPDGDAQQQCRGRDGRGQGRIGTPCGGMRPRRRRLWRRWHRQ